MQFVPVPIAATKCLADLKITNLDTYGIDAFMPIVNLPEAVILGVERIVKKPAVVEDEISIRRMMRLSLSIEHRVIDGVPEAEFLEKVSKALSTADI